MHLPALLRLTYLAICLLLVTACGTFEVGIEPTRVAEPRRVIQSTRLSVQVTPAATVSPIPTPTSEPTDTPAAPDKTPTATALSPVPQVNTLYLGTHSGRYAVFVRSTDDTQSYPTDSYLGSVIDADDRLEDSFDFRKLEQPSQILSSNLNLMISSLKADESTRLLYAALIQLSSPTEYKHIERIIEINPADLTNRDVWTLEIPGHKYPGVSGGAVIDQVTGHFVNLRLFDCYGCEPGPLQPILVLNANTGREKFLGAVGNVIFDLRANTVLYRNLQSFREKCEPSPGCDSDGYGTVYAPAGEVITEQLP